MPDIYSRVRRTPSSGFSGASDRLIRAASLDKSLIVIAPGGSVFGTPKVDTPETKTVPIVFQPIMYAPPHIGGDTDFDGNGPWFTVSVHIIKTGPIARVKVTASFQETKKDWTFFAGDYIADVFNARTEYGEGWTIDALHGMLFDTISGTDMDHAVDAFPRSGRLVSMYRIMGDADGGVFGGDDRPWVEVHFNPVEITLVRR